MTHTRGISAVLACLNYFSSGQFESQTSHFKPKSNHQLSGAENLKPQQKKMLVQLLICNESMLQMRGDKTLLDISHLEP
jgi:hypothetical protein